MRYPWSGRVIYENRQAPQSDLRASVYPHRYMEDLARDAAPWLQGESKERWRILCGTEEQARNLRFGHGYERRWPGGVATMLERMLRAFFADNVMYIQWNIEDPERGQPTPRFLVHPAWSIRYEGGQIVQLPDGPGPNVELARCMRLRLPDPLRTQVRRELGELVELEQVHNALMGAMRAATHGATAIDSTRGYDEVKRRMLAVTRDSGFAFLAANAALSPPYQAVRAIRQAYFAQRLREAAISLWNAMVAPALQEIGTELQVGFEEAWTSDDRAALEDLAHGEPADCDRLYRILFYEEVL